MNKHHIRLGIFLTIIVFIIHVFILDDYGLTWDFHHHFFAGLTRLGRPITDDLTKFIPFTNPSPLITNDLPFGPLMSIVPVLSYQLFFEKLKLLAFDNAYNLAIVASGVSGIGILYFFMLEATNFPTALASLIFLTLLPRYFGDLHNNMKDVPQSAAFAFAIWMFWRLVKYQRVKDLLLASIAFAIAFNTKVNTLVMPIIAGLWILILHILNLRNSNDRVLRVTRAGGPPRRGPLVGFLGGKPAAGPVRILLYFLFSPMFALLLWIPFWKDPFGTLLYIPKFFQINTINIEVLLNGTWYCSGINVPWYYPFWYLAITTPLPILIFFLIGLISLIRPINLIKKPLASLLLLWFFLPLTRYFWPKMGVIDGIRHFEEVVYPLSAIAAIGAINIYTFIKPILPKIFIRLIGLIGLISLMGNIVLYHPFQISYFNELVGGIKGAYGKYDIDYWGGPQKIAIGWINNRAPVGSTVTVAMAADAAAKYLRPDLLTHLNTTSYDKSDYVVILNRQSFFYRYYAATNFMLTHTPIHTIQNQGVPIVWIYDNRSNKPLDIPQRPWWTGEDPCIKAQI